jgi:rSAM/selenodomain-associated transferase 1
MTTAIAVMAKAPCPGKSKTRLVPHLTAEQAAILSAAFLGDVTANLARAAAAAAAAIVPYLAYAPAGTANLFDDIVAPGTRLLLADGSGHAPAGVQGFGRCLLHAIEAMLAQGHQAACVLNADSPNLPTQFLLTAAASLARADCVVMGPAEDGGYYLLGMRAAHAHLFAGIDWSTSHVAAQTRARAAEAGLTLVELDPWYDVDEPASLARLAAELNGARPRGAFEAPHTASCLAHMATAMPLLERHENA